MIGLRKRLFQIVVTSAAIIATVMGGAAIVFSALQSKWNFDQTAAQMESQLNHQQKDIAVSYLIPEQESGRKLLLEKYMSSENLVSASVIEPNEHIPSNFSKCVRSDSPTRCQSVDGKLVAGMSQELVHTL